MRYVIFAISIGLGVTLAAACDDINSGGAEGNRCNALVLHDECDDGLFCKAASCSASYCCPRNGASGDPNCNSPGCPDDDAGSTDADAPLDATLTEN